MAAERGRDEGATWTPAADPLARVVFFVLVIACFAAFFVTQRLKHTPTAVQDFKLTPSFTPGSPDPEQRLERIAFKLASADAVTVTIVDAGGATVATLVTDRPLARYKQLSLRWNGRRGVAHRYEVLTSPSGHRTLVPVNEGALAPPGEYRVIVRLHRQDREIPSPRYFTLVGG